MKGWRWCFLCKKKYGTSDTSFFGVPQCQIRKKRWETSCGVDLPQRSFLCDKHFCSTDYINPPGNPGKNRLLPGAVPVLYTPADLAVSICENEYVTIDAGARDCTAETVHTSETETISYQKRHQKGNEGKESDATSTSNSKTERSQSEYIELINEKLFDDNTFHKIEKFKNPIVDPVGENRVDDLDIVKCGFVNVTKGNEKYYYLTCFYCPVIFPIHEWQNFAIHVTEIHEKLETQFSLNLKTSNNDERSTSPKSDQEEFLSEDSPVKICERSNSTDSSNLSAYEPIINEDSISEKEDEQKTQDAPELDNLTTVCEMDKEVVNEKYSNNLSLEHNYSQKTNSTNDESRTQAKCNQIRFGKTDPAIVIDFLQNLKLFPCLWYTDWTAIDTYEDALEVVLARINTNWGLKLTKPVLRNNLECIKRYYNSTLENRKQYENYRPLYEDYVKICAEIKNGNGDEVASKASTLTKTISRRFVGKREKSFICPICDKGFFYQDRFKSHVQLHSEEIRPHKCDICDRHYLTESMLRQHKKRHGPPKYVCSICSKSYAYAFNFEMHMKIHNGKFEYMCEWCGKGFVDKKPYMTHVKYKHVSEGRCNICKHSCHSAAALDKHLIACHRPLIISEDLQRVVTNQKVENYKDPHPFIKTNQRRPRRELKPRKYKRRYHSIIDPDTGLRRICCPDCDKNYRAYDTLYAHISKVHGYEPMKESFAPNKVRKPNPGHFKRKYPEGTLKKKTKKVKPAKSNESKSNDISNTGIATFELTTASDTISVEPLSINTQIKYETSSTNIEEVNEFVVASSLISEEPLLLNAQQTEDVFSFIVNRDDAVYF